MFLGHVNDLKDTEWRVFPQLNNWALCNSNGKYFLSSNVCPHQGSILKDTSGKKARVCPYHGWSFKYTGEPLGSGTTEHQCKNLETLETKEVYIWEGFIFSEEHDLPPADFINTDHLKLVEQRVDMVKSNVTSILHLFLDVDHIPIVHPRVYNQLTSTEIKWDIRESSSVQLVPATKDFTSDYTESFLAEDKNLTYGAGWFTVYPYTMMEWQPGAWFITVCSPKDNLTNVTVYKYKDTRYSEDNWKLNEEIWETAWVQDCEQSEQISPNFNSKYLEKQKVHYNEWVSRHRL